jgi:hypothetical protein
MKNFTMEKARNIRSNPIKTWKIVALDFFTLSSFHAAVSILNPAYIIYITPTIPRNASRYIIISWTYTENFFVFSISLIFPLTTWVPRLIEQYFAEVGSLLLQ